MPMMLLEFIAFATFAFAASTKSRPVVEVKSDGGVALLARAGQLKRFKTEVEPLVTDACARKFDPCRGGQNKRAPSCCEDGTRCIKLNEYFSQCLPSTSTVRPQTSLPLKSTTGTTTNTAAPLAGWAKGTWTTGYWDCCKPSCAWPGKGNVNSSTLACHAMTGERLTDASIQSVCNGGLAASCSNHQPFKVTETLSMGFAAAAVSGNFGLRGDVNCGQCYELKFTAARHPDGNWGGTHPALVGKSMIVQVTNIGYDVTGSHSFDIQIPGAGQGAFDQGCSRQFNGFNSADFDCSNRYGGCNDKSGCKRLPEVLRPGCEWRYDWYRWLQTDTTNNPFVDFRRVRCPQRLTSISGSVASDDMNFPEIFIETYS